MVLDAACMEAMATASRERALLLGIEQLVANGALAVWVVGGGSTVFDEHSSRRLVTAIDGQLVG